VNTWIRTSGAFDAVFDLDAVTRDPRDPHRFRPEADAPDMLHPGDAGYKLMADSIDLSVLTGTRSSSARVAAAPTTTINAEFAETAEKTGSVLPVLRFLR
jgi:hypothetical protein